jgi:outer membrane protein assembly factor BamD (BamD/ComL family)
MSKLFFLLVLCLSFLVGAAAQGPVRGPDKAATADSETEVAARHDLEVARQYFKLKKAYVASLSRAEELVAGYPTFSKRDEALYIAGMSSFFLAEGKGKQRSTVKPDQLRANAREFLAEIVNNYPKSEYFAEADKLLKSLGEAKKQ